jgi:hypothetical protein
MHVVGIAIAWHDLALAVRHLSVRTKEGVVLARPNFHVIHVRSEPMKVITIASSALLPF